MWMMTEKQNPQDVSETVTCADCLQSSTARRFFFYVSRIFRSLREKRHTPIASDEEQAAGLIMEGARLLVEAASIDPRLKPIVRETIQVLQQGVMKLANADSGGDF